MARNIEIPKTGKFINVQKRGKNTLLTLGDKSNREATAESKTFLVLTPAVIPLILFISTAPAIAQMRLDNELATNNSLIIALASVPSYISFILVALVGAVTLASSFKIGKMFFNTEPSNIVLSPEDIATIAQEKSEKRTIVQGNITKDSTESIIQSFISQAYPEMIVESQNIEYDYVNDRSFSKIFNTEAA